MIIVKVFNHGERTRHRLGVRFSPKQEVKLTVGSRQLLTLKAVRDFEITILEDAEVLEETKTSSQDAQEGSKLKDIDLSELNISEVLKIVQEGKLTPDEAIAIELTGKNRTTLIDKLENMKEGS